MHRCVAAASKLAGSHTSTASSWLANIGIDEYLLPSGAGAAKRRAADRLGHALSLATSTNASTAANRGARCLSIRRHNFYAPEQEVGQSYADGHTERQSYAMAPSPVRTRLWRAPFPPWPDGGQPYLPRWVVRLPAPSNLVANSHEMWYADECRSRCAADELLHDDRTRGRDLEHRSTSHESNPNPNAGTALAEAQLSPIALACFFPAAAAERCVLAGRVIGSHDPMLPVDIGEQTDASATSFARLASFRQCLFPPKNDSAQRAQGAAPRPPKGCWREACVHGSGPESWLRVHHYGSTSTEAAYSLDRSSEPVRDQHALAFVT